MSARVAGACGGRRPPLRGTSRPGRSRASLPRVAPARRSGDHPSHRMDAGSAGDVRRSGSPGPSSLETVPEADFGAGLGYAGPAVDDQAALWCDGGRPPLEQEAEHVPVVGGAVPRPVGPEPAGLPRPGPSARPPASPFLSSRSLSTLEAAPPAWHVLFDDENGGDARVVARRVVPGGTPGDGQTVTRDTVSFSCSTISTILILHSNTIVSQEAQRKDQKMAGLFYSFF